MLNCHLSIKCHKIKADRTTQIIQMIKVIAKFINLAKISIKTY